jgi:hypothetical protein
MPSLLSHLKSPTNNQKMYTHKQECIPACIPTCSPEPSPQAARVYSVSFPNQNCQKLINQASNQKCILTNKNVAPHVYPHVALNPAPRRLVYTLYHFPTKNFKTRKIPRMNRKIYIQSCFSHHSMVRSIC